MGVISEFTTALATFMGDDYYYRKAPTAVTYPYRVGKFNGSFPDENSETFAFEMDYWDKSNDDSALRDLIDSDAGDGIAVNPSGLNKKRFYLNSGTVVLERDGMVDVEDPDKSLIHIRVSYTARVYRKE